jgi:hypothetical protein
MIRYFISHICPKQTGIGAHFHGTALLMDGELLELEIVV